MDALDLGGQILGGRFRVEGFARDEPAWLVYRARDDAGAAVTLKCLKATAPALAERLHARLSQEVPIVARLSGEAPGICPLLGCGLAKAKGTPHPILFVAQPWLSGISLGEDLRQRRIAKRADRSWTEIRALFAGAAAALGAAHGGGLVHHDLSPETLFLEGSGLRVLDFGLTAALEQEAAATEEVQTRVGSRLPHYTAPEAFDARFGPYGPWTDVYAFALVMLEAASGQRARKGKGYSDVALEVLEQRLVPTPRKLGMPVPDELEELFASALALGAGERPRDLPDLWSRFETVLALGGYAAPRADEGPLTRPRVAEGSVTRQYEPRVVDDGSVTRQYQPRLVDDGSVTRHVSPVALPQPVREMMGASGNDEPTRVVRSPLDAPDSSPPTVVVAGPPLTVRVEAPAVVLEPSGVLLEPPGVILEPSAVTLAMPGPVTAALPTPVLPRPAPPPLAQAPAAQPAMQFRAAPTAHSFPDLESARRTPAPARSPLPAAGRPAPGRAAALAAMEPTAVGAVATAAAPARAPRTVLWAVVVVLLLALVVATSTFFLMHGHAGGS